MPADEAAAATARAVPGAWRELVEGAGHCPGTSGPAACGPRWGAGERHLRLGQVSGGIPGGSPGSNCVQTVPEFRTESELVRRGG
jgi:hypothetical protein